MILRQASCTSELICSHECFVCSKMSRFRDNKRFQMSELSCVLTNDVGVLQKQVSSLCLWIISKNLIITSALAAYFRDILPFFQHFFSRIYCIIGVCCIGTAKRYTQRQSGSPVAASIGTFHLVLPQNHRGQIAPKCFQCLILHTMLRK
jgi:hypothetical protein